ncbi:hypothetical protein Tco_0577252, partial [Tanacetum coccineum]
MISTKATMTLSQGVSFLATHSLARNFFDSINTDAFILSHWVNLFQMDEPVY